MRDPMLLCPFTSHGGCAIHMFIYFIITYTFTLTLILPIPHLLDFVIITFIHAKNIGVLCFILKRTLVMPRCMPFHENLTLLSSVGSKGFLHPLSSFSNLGSLSCYTFLKFCLVLQ